MERSASTHEHTPLDSSAPAQPAERRGPTEQRDDGRRLFPMLLLGGVLALYVAIGYVIYTMIAAVA
jgi:hypothetical protein